MQPHPLAEHIADLFLRPGSPPAAEGMDAAHRARIRFEWRSGQWVLLAPANKFYGWMSWYRCDDEVLALLREERIDELIRRGDPRDLTQGPHVYVATAVVAPHAPPDTYRELFKMVCAANRDARIVAGHLTKRNGRRCWHQRTPHLH